MVAQCPRGTVPKRISGALSLPNRRSASTLRNSGTITFWSSFIRRDQPGGEEKCVVIPRLEFWLLSFPSFS